MEMIVSAFATARPTGSIARAGAARSVLHAGTTCTSWRAVLPTLITSIAAIALLALVSPIRSMVPTRGADGAAIDDATVSWRAGSDARGGVPARYRVYADCLWPVARNHGFFELQVQALAGDAAARALWLDFVASTGANDCADGSADIVADTASLERALVQTRRIARQHFAATGP